MRKVLDVVVLNVEGCEGFELFYLLRQLVKDVAGEIEALRRISIKLLIAFEGGIGSR